MLVFFGGMDADNLTEKTIQVLANVGHESLQVDVVIGAQHPARESIQAACGRYGYQCHVQTEKMAELMARADLAIGAGGSATWERCCMGLPTLTVCVAENQRQLVADAALEGLLYAPAFQADVINTLKLHIQTLIENPFLRTSISRAGMLAVDGRGIFRVMRKLGCSEIAMRLASPADSQALFNWRNHPSIRAVSRASDPITWEAHQHWLASVLSDRNRPLLIGSRFDKPVGVVRFDIEADKAEVSIYVVPDLNEPGLGADVLASAEHWLAENRPGICVISAEVLGDNSPSHGLFRSSGYQTGSTGYIKRLH